MKEFPSVSARAGFTLMEMIIVIGVTMILSGLILGYSRSSEKQISLYKDQAAIVGFLNEAKSLAIQKYNQPGTAGYIACAFGVHFETTNIFAIFQDLEPGNVCPKNRTYAYDANANPTELINSSTLDTGIIFSDLSGGSSLDIEFIAPELTVTSTIANPSVTLRTTSGISARIEVGAGGQIVTQ